MRCASDRLLQAYIDGELAGPASLGLEGHLRDCPACREKLGLLREAGDLVKERFPSLDPAGIPAAPPFRTRESRRPAPVARLWGRLGASRIRVPAAVLAMACFFVIGMAAGTALRRPREARETRGPWDRTAPAQVALTGPDRVRVIPAGLDLRGYGPIAHPEIFTFKEQRP